MKCGNVQDRYTVPVQQGNTVISHVPRKFWKFVRSSSVQVEEFGVHTLELGVFSGPTSRTAGSALEVRISR